MAYNADEKVVIYYSLETEFYLIGMVKRNTEHDNHSLFHHREQIRFTPNKTLVKCVNLHEVLPLVCLVPSHLTSVCVSGSHLLD